MQNQKVIDYIKSTSQCFDTYWFIDVCYHGLWFFMLFDEEFKLVCVNYEIFTNKIANIKCELSEHDSKLIYNEFLHNVGE